MPNPVLWGVVAGLLHFVPYVGAAVGVSALGLAAFVTLPTLGDAVLPPLLYLLFTAIEANLVSPFVLGRAFHLNPLVIFVWLVFWGWLWGIGGAVIAVPLLVLLKITCDQSHELRPISELLER
jgi:predicted PurR-regulated permease PerM